MQSKTGTSLFLSPDSELQRLESPRQWISLRGSQGDLSPFSAGPPAASGQPAAESRLKGDVAEWAVDLSGVRKTYQMGPIKVPALRGVDLRIAPGEFLAIAGPSGSGKTTLLNIVGGLDRADTGEVWVAGQNLQLLSSGKLARLRLHRIGFVFQAYNLLPVLTALENAEFTLLLQGVPARERRNKVLKLFSEIGLAGVEDRRPVELSGGQQQRVAVARALVTEPALSVAPELAKTDPQPWRGSMTS
jgi:putative ABC transport system ATP-binding protein